MYGVGSLRQVVADLGFVEAEVMTEFVDEGFVDLSAELVSGAAALLDTLAIEGDLAGNGVAGFVMMARDALEEAEQVEGMGDVHLLEDVIRWDIFDGDGDFIEVVANVLG